MSKIINKTAFLILISALILGAYWYVEVENKRFHISFNCIEPVPFQIKILQEDINHVDWEKQVWHLKPNTINKLNNIELPKFGKVANLNNRICYGACILNAILDKDTLFRIKMYCFIAPVSVQTDTLPVIFLNYTNEQNKDSLVYLFSNNSLHLNVDKDLIGTNGKVSAIQQELNETLDNSRLKAFLEEKDFFIKKNDEELR